MSELKYKDITEKIIGAAMKVHATLGNGFTHRNNYFLKEFVNALHFRK